MEILLLNQSTESYKTFPMHEHGCWEIIFNTAGTGTADIGDRLTPFREGTIFCIPPGVPHRKTSEDGFTDWCLFARQLVPLSPDGVVCVEDDSPGSFRTLFRMAHEAQLRAEGNAKGVISAIGDVMHQLIAGWAAGGQRRMPAVEQLQRVILDNVGNCGFDLAGELERTGYSVSHFRKLFREQVGRSPLDYLHHVRIEQSRRMLQQYQGIYTIKQIALSCGFDDPYWFSRLFKQCTGMAPETYVRGLGKFAGEEIAAGQEAPFE